MTTERILKFSVLNLCAAYIAVLSVLIPLAAPAQQTGTGNPFLPKKHVAAVGPDTPLFLPAVAYDSGGFDAASVAVADVNGDGKLDIIVANQCGNSSNCFYYLFGFDGTVAVLLGNGDGTFQPPLAYASGGETPVSVAVADVNGDGKPDIIVANKCASGTNCNSGTGSVGILLGNGDGTFQAAATYNSGGVFAVSLALADFNGDGKTDLAVAHSAGADNSCCNSPALGVLLGNGDGTFQPAIMYGKGGETSVAVGDVNGDRSQDLVVTSFADPGVDGVEIFLGNGNGTFQAPVVYDTGAPFPYRVAIADLNGDGKLDLVVDHTVSDARLDSLLGILLGRGDGTFQAPVIYDSGVNPAVSVAVSDVDRDGRPDLLVAGDSGLGVLLGNSDGTFQPALTYGSGGQLATSVLAADVNGDGKPDLVAGNVYASNSLNGAVGVLLNNAVALNSTTTTLTSSLNPSTYGQLVTFTAHVISNSGTPAGTVILRNGLTTVGSGTLTNGSAAITVSSLPVGADSITAAYQGGGGFAPSTSTPLAQTVSKATTATALASSLNPAGTNQSISFTATVTGQFGGAATGSVAFVSGSQTLGTATLSGNHATLTTSFSATGTYSISAKYNGDGNNAGSTSPTLSQAIIASTTTALTSSLNPSVVGQAVTFTATVTSPAGAPPNGELITFKNGSAVLGTAALSGGIASLTTSSLAAGVYTITATYGGDANFTASTSPGLRQVVNSASKSATSTTLSSSLNPSTYGQSVTWKATVTTSGPVPPTGSVTFSWSTYTIGSATLNSSGIATLTKSNLNVYTYPLVAVYKGDSSNLGSTSAILNQVVKQATSAATVTSSPNPSIQGQAVTFTAKITSPTVVPTGPVTFTLGNTVLGTVQLSGGKATFTTSRLPVGTDTVTVTYPWNSNIASSSASIAQVVNQ